MIGSHNYEYEEEIEELRAMVAKLESYLASERNCGQETVCAKPPGCMMHWEERCRELVKFARDEYDRGRAEGRCDVAKYSNAIGRIESALGIHSAVPLNETVIAVEALCKGTKA